MKSSVDFMVVICSNTLLCLEVKHKMTQIQKHNTSNIQWLFIDLHKYNSGGKGKVHDEMLFSGR